MSDVRVGAHAAYDRIVFEFTGGRPPTVTVERARPPFTADPSGLPLEVPGSWFITVRMVPSSGEGYARPDGQATYTGPTTFLPGYARLKSLVRAGDFEGYLTWIAGLSGPMCYRVLVLADPTRLVVDLRAR